MPRKWLLDGKLGFFFRRSQGISAADRMDIHLPGGDLLYAPERVDKA
jgi:hypothetical protein